MVLSFIPVSPFGMHCLLFRRILVILQRYNCLALDVFRRRSRLTISGVFRLVRCWTPRLFVCLKDSAVVVVVAVCGGGGVCLSVRYAECSGPCARGDALDLPSQNLASVPAGCNLSSLLVVSCRRHRLCRQKWLGSCPSSWHRGTNRARC
jgi:hypothetical protein